MRGHGLRLGLCTLKPLGAQDGDPYKEEMEQCVAMIMARLRARGVQNHHTLAYQSRVGPVRLLSFSPPGPRRFIMFVVVVVVRHPLLA